jgi:chromosome partitioning protein
MHTIALVAQKGGTGKTTLAVSFAVAASNSGLVSLLIDLDPQATACKWSDRRKQDTPLVIDAQASRLAAALGKAAQNGVDFVLIDTPPRSEQAALAAAKAADLVLIPCRPQAYDLETIPNSQEILSLSGNKPALVILNAVPARGDRHEQAKTVLDRFSIPVCPHTIGARAAFGDSAALGQTPQEYDPEGKAAGEIRQAYKYTQRLVSSLKKTQEEHESQEKSRSDRVAG